MYMIAIEECQECITLNKHQGKVSVRLQGRMKYFDKYQPNMNKIRRALTEYLTES